MTRAACIGYTVLLARQYSVKRSWLAINHKIYCCKILPSILVEMISKCEHRKTLETRMGSPVDIDSFDQTS